MAYVSKETKKELAPEIKKVLAEFGVKGLFGKFLLDCLVKMHSLLVR